MGAVDEVLHSVPDPFEEQERAAEPTWDLLPADADTEEVAPTDDPDPSSDDIVEADEIERKL